MTRLVLPEHPNADDALEAFLGWVADQGLELYPAQEEAILALFAGSHVILTTPTGSGKSLVATAGHVAALAAGLPVDVLPGATALVPGLLLSGLPPQPFTFYGFLPEGRSDRRCALEALKTHPWTLVFYLSPHKAERHLEDLASLWGDRAAVLVREISNIDIAFFDEPTANLDDVRREALARQVMNIRGFRQLFVISHDDTFEQVTQNLVRVKRHGSSSIVAPNES